MANHTIELNVSGDGVVLDVVDALAVADVDEESFRFRRLFPICHHSIYASHSRHAIEHYGVIFLDLS